MRYNFYPKVRDMGTVKPGQVRCGEHTDYGAISVLFQDDIGGLEVYVQCSQECLKIVCFSFFLTVSEFFKSKLKENYLGCGSVTVGNLPRLN